MNNPVKEANVITDYLIFYLAIKLWNVLTSQVTGKKLPIPVMHQCVSAIKQAVTAKQISELKAF